MTRRLAALPLALLLAPAVSFGQSGRGWHVAQGELTFARLAADPLEPRLGSVIYTDRNKLRLDIGNSLDLATWRAGSAPEAARISVGVDLATHTLLRREPDFHFPVEASDYLFGVNLTGRRRIGATDLAGRLRISHISAHLVDGRFDKDSQTWRDGRLPRVYSREYVEGTVSGRRSMSGFGVRLYGGAQALFHVAPELPKLTGQLGGELTRRLAPVLTGYLAHDLKLRGTGSGAVGSMNSTQLGLRLGRPDGRNVDAFVTRYVGLSQHGELFDQPDPHWAVGLLFGW